MKHLIEEIIVKYKLKTIHDLLNLIPLYMCHITQESSVFDTYNPMTIKMAYPEKDWQRYEEIYHRYSEEIIPSLTLQDYLQNFIDQGPRLPCFCSEIGDVFGSILSSMLKQTVYVIRRVYVNYLTQPTRRHCLNAIIENGRVRYIDAAVYNQVLDKKNRKLIHPSSLTNFNAADIDEVFLVSENWLHNTPFQRKIYFEKNIIKDNFYPNPDKKGIIDEYLRQYENGEVVLEAV